MLAPGDHVAVALRGLRAGECIVLDGVALVVERDTALGHKIAARDITDGERILKYRCPIGRATRAIAAGAYVHTHNLASNYLPTTTLP
ncbi:MAG: UxaA family hydrolase [Rubrivivax sp.]